MASKAHETEAAKSPQVVNRIDASDDDELTAVSYLPPDVPLCEDENLVEILTDLISADNFKNVENNSTENTLQQTLNSLLKIVDGILCDPANKQTRKINSENPNFKKRIGNYKDAIRFLLAIGFTKDQDLFWVMEIAWLSRITDARRCLELIMKNELKMQVPAPPVSTKFNPYRSNLSSSRPDADKFCEAAEKCYPGDTHAEKSALVRELKTGGSPVVDLNLKFFKLTSPGQPLPQFPEADSETWAHGGLSREQLESIKASMTGTHTFKSASRMELEKLSKMPFFTKSTIRIKFPDSTFMQMDLKPSTLGLELIQIVGKYLSKDFSSMDSAYWDQHGKNIWYLYESPPKRILDEKKTLYEQGFVPTATLHFGVHVQLPRRLLILERDLIK